MILSTEPRWRGLTLAEALALRPPQSAIAARLAGHLGLGECSRPTPMSVARAVMRTEARIPFRGWRLTSFTTYDSIREQVNAVLALEIMGFAVLLALIFYLLSRRARLQSALFRRRIGRTCGS